MPVTIVGFETLAEFKSNFGSDTKLQLLLAPDFPTIEDFKLYWWDITSHLVPDDDQVIKPDDILPESAGRWRQCEANFLQVDWSAASGPKCILNKPTIPTITPFAVGAPNTGTVALATAYRATDVTAPALVTLSLSSQSSISLSGAVNNEGEVRIGPTAAVASGSGSRVGVYKNNLGGTLVIGLNLQSVQSSAVSFVLPAGWYYAVRQTLGTGLSVVAALDQKLSN